MVKRIRVLTFNIFTGKFHLDQNRIKNQIEQVKALDCDIMCFQEVQHDLCLNQNQHS